LVEIGRTRGTCGGEEEYVEGLVGKTRQDYLEDLGKVVGISKWILNGVRFFDFFHFEKGYEIKGGFWGHGSEFVEPTRRV
jgi:hypothetical protein